MQSKKECEFCQKSRIMPNIQGVKFGCQDPFCIFIPIVKNSLREQIIKETNKKESK